MGCMAPPSPDSFECPIHGILNLDSVYVYGKRQFCKTCVAIRSRNYYVRNKSRIRKKTRIYRLKNSEKVRSRKQIWHKENFKKVRSSKKFYFEANKEKILTKKRAYWKKNKTKFLADKKLYYQKNKVELSAKKKIYRVKNAVRIAQVKKNRSIKIKFDAISHYSDGRLCCALCQEPDLRFLCLDHRDGGGTQHRAKQPGVRGKSVYWWAKKNNYPPIFQVLCYNCNFSQIKRAQSHKKSLIGFKYRQKLKNEVFSYYSKGRPICAICGKDSIDILTIDHINGGGRRHLISMKMKGGTQFYKYLKDNKFPDGYRILCFNCNCSK